ncbi:hypothetical protein A2814_01235 [Candidatus Nomurabacteria bacterium RIFCSPHIGHO2_01_FULL_38_19]|uniref:Type I restriction modification DNA specificity domain-containing protein n=1 Tax=Candidatus Nomurabacteria bacterium RIFCSPHIGHO2_01_FULL_38_19 TaxID=1801732 RepID=A0A1F6UQP0_9BACT|nr:MAG: hypothetical protein A2814_01235 [Candidatus Nomurabacteria bacterium RIFCSPHIGHO2_01_FULL_38_19]
MQASNVKNKCFAIWSNEVEGRFDPHFYKPDFLLLEKMLKKINYAILGEVVDFSNEVWNGKDFFTDKFPYIEISEIDIHTGEIKNITYYEKSEAPSRAKMIVRNNDIIVSTTRPHRGAIAFIDNSRDGFIASTGFAVLRDLKNKEVNKNYLFYILRTSFILDQMLQRSSGGNYPAITAEELQKIIIPLPPLATQNEIVEIMKLAYRKKASKEQKAESILSSIDDYTLGELDIKIANLKNKNCFCVSSKDVAGKRLDPKGYLGIPQIIIKAIKKSKYNTKMLSELLDSSIAGEWGEDNTLENNEGYSLIKVLRNTNFDNQSNLNFDDVAERFIENKKLEKVELKNGDILIEKSGGSPIQPVGRVALIENLKDRFTFSNFLQCFRVKKECLPEYLFCFLKALYGLNYMEYLQNQTTGIKNLIMEEYLSIPVPLPSIDIQKKLADEFRNRLENANKLKAEAIEEVEKAKIFVENLVKKG